MLAFVRVLVLALVIGLSLRPSESSRKKCKIVPLAARSSLKAQAIFRGRIVAFFFRRLGAKRPAPTFAAKIQVHEVFRDLGGLRVGEHVILEGLGAPHICGSRPRPIGGTGLFFADYLERRTTRVRHMRLRDSILKPLKGNLRYLRRFRQAGRRFKNTINIQYRDKVNANASWC